MIRRIIGFVPLVLSAVAKRRENDAGHAPPFGASLWTRLVRTYFISWTILRLQQSL
jgi:hypothetical protein